MSKVATNPSAPSTTNSDGLAIPPEELVRAFNNMRDELVSTLWFLLGNQEDAQDAAQEAFLKCWRAQANLRGIRNLRAWIFRVGLNAAKDLRRSAWYRRAKPLRGEEVLVATHEVAP